MIADRHGIASLRRVRSLPAWADCRGIAAVEFALVLPLLLLLYLGCVDLTRGVMAIRKVDILSRTISDLVSQQSNATPMPSSTLSLIFTTASAIMVPYPTNSLTMTVSAIDIKAVNGLCCQALVRWSYTQGGTQRACSTPLTQVPDGTPPKSTNIPASIVNANVVAGYNYVGGQTSYVIVTDITYQYTPFFSQSLPWFTSGTRKTTFMVPRSTSGPLTMQSPVAPAAGQNGTICF